MRSISPVYCVYRRPLLTFDLSGTSVPSRPPGLFAASLGPAHQSNWCARSDCVLGSCLTTWSTCAPVRTGAIPMSTSTLQFHRYANVFPLLDGDELDAL